MAKPQKRGEMSLTTILTAATDSNLISAVSLCPSPPWMTSCFLISILGGAFTF